MMDWTLTLGAIEKDLLPFLAVGGGMSIAVIAVVGSYIRSIVVSRAHEVSRREIAAYVAEGSMSAEEGARLLSTKPPHAGCCGK